MRLLYPTRAPARTQRVGPYEIDMAMNAAAESGPFPLIVISHGGGGFPLTHRDLAAHLVRAGFVVALPEHPGNSRTDNRLEGTAANLANRPRHIRLAIDAAFTDPAIGALLSHDQVALIGHSMGGYTALAVAGGRPIASPHETLDGTMHPVAVTPDARVRALVLLAPACGWFWADGALCDVDVPILLRTAEKDEHAHFLHAEFIERGVRDRRRVDAQVIPNAGHHAFQSPFPQSMMRPDFRPSQDPEGFDRAAFQPVLAGEIVEFLRRAL
jgi:predicted dienelactone hydrolase